MPSLFSATSITAGCAPGYKKNLCDEFIVGASYKTADLEKCFVVNSNNEWTPKKGLEVFGFGGKNQAKASTTLKDGLYKVEKLQGTSNTGVKGEVTTCGQRFGAYGDCCWKC